MMVYCYVAADKICAMTMTYRYENYADTRDYVIDTLLLRVRLPLILRKTMITTSLLLRHAINEEKSADIEMRDAR